MCILWNPSAISVSLYYSGISLSLIILFQIVYVVTDCKDNLICLDLLVHKLKHQQICHLPDDKPGLIVFIRTRQNLPRTHTVALWFIGLDIRNRTGFPAPRMIYEEFRIYAEQSV